MRASREEQPKHMHLPIMEQLLSSSIALLLAFLLLQLHQLPLLVIGVAAQAHSNQLNAGSTMTPTSNLLQSSSGVFAFGFCRFDPSLHPNQFILAIWFDFNARDCTSKSMVWFARDIRSKDAVIATEQYVLDFHGDSPLSLISDQQQAVWTPSEKYGSSSTLVLQESGNLQLFGKPGGGGGVADVLWESFADPTDVLLLGNNITVGPADPSRQLLSKKTYTDFSSGRFVLVVQNDSNVVLYMRDQESGIDYPYWSIGTYYPDACVTTLFFNESGIYHHLTNCIYSNFTFTNGAVLQLDKNYTEGYFKYMVLDPDGTVRVYVHPKKNTDGNSWDMVRLFPESPDGCTRTGICGPNSYCTVSADKQLLNCSCPESYEFLDAHHSYKGCTPNFIPYICDGKDHSSEFKTVEMQTTSWSTASTYKKYASPPDDPSHHECSTSCLNNCLCAAVLIDDNNSCMEVWTLTAGRQESGIAMKSLIKVRQSKPAIKSGSLTTKLLYVLIVVLATVCVVSIMYILLWQFCITKKKARMSMLSGLISFTYKEMKEATGGFKEELGKGAFGQVFKGELKYPEPRYVAVKLIRSDELGEKDFDNEVQSIGQIHHKNLARLIGYCKEGMHRMLVFQYMEGGTLAGFIFRSERGRPRPCWSCLAEAAIGIARGLEYLHEGCKSQIIHCDIKPDNILFDDIHTPKITDFGIARLLGDEKTQYTVTSGGIIGTKPYAAPEWFDRGGKVDNKVDVYSFGVMLLEMICCRRAADGGQPNDQGESTTLRAWVESLVRSETAELLVQGESEAMADMESVERFARVAIWCLQEAPSARPTMHKVVQMLEGTVDVDPPLPEPPRPTTFSAIVSANSNRSLPDSAVALEID